MPGQLHFKNWATVVLSMTMLPFGNLGNENPRFICDSTYVDERLKRLSAYFSYTALWCF
jgi:hypothetical protein